MLQRRPVRKKRKRKRDHLSRGGYAFLLHRLSELTHKHSYMNKHIDKLWEQAVHSNRRLQDIEVQTNLITRLLTTLAIERIGMKLSAFRRLVRQIEKEAIADSEVSELEELFRLEHKGAHDRIDKTHKRGH